MHASISLWIARAAFCRGCPGARFRVRAEQDLIVGLTACSAEKSNGGVCKPIDFELSSPTA